MAHRPLTLSLMLGGFAICRLAADTGIPAWAARGEFFSITRTPDELSVVLSEAHVPKGTRGDWGWRCFRVEGPMPLCQNHRTIEPQSLRATEVGRRRS